MTGKRDPLGRGRVGVGAREREKDRKGRKEGRKGGGREGSPCFGGAVHAMLWVGVSLEGEGGMLVVLFDFICLSKSLPLNLLTSASPFKSSCLLSR